MLRISRGRLSGPGLERLEVRGGRNRTRGLRRLLVRQHLLPDRHGFEPLERPFFLARLPPRGPARPTLLVPKLDAEHMKKARSIAEHPDLLGVSRARRPAVARTGSAEMIGSAQRVRIEPSLRRRIAEELRDLTVAVDPLVEELAWSSRRPRSR